VLEDLENLRKNGRLTKLQAVVTGALRIKLFCHATPEGEIGKVGQALTVKQALAKLVDRAAEDPDHVGRPLLITHVNCLERAFQVKKMIEEKTANIHRVCGMCHKTVIQIKDANGKIQSTTDIYVDNWGYERNFCKECMRKKGNNQRWKF
jgi:fatty acid-binding protein DegV